MQVREWLVGHVGNLIWEFFASRKISIFKGLLAYTLKTIDSSGLLTNAHTYDIIVILTNHEDHAFLKMAAICHFCLNMLFHWKRVKIELQCNNTTVYLAFSPLQQEMTLQENTDCMKSIQFLVYHRLIQRHSTKSPHALRIGHIAS